MTKAEFKKAFDLKWLISNAGNLALLGGVLWFLVAPHLVDAVRAGAPKVVEECFDSRDKNPDTFRGQCADLVIRVAAEQTEKRLKALEQKTDDLARTQKTIIYQVGEVNKDMPELKGSVKSIQGNVNTIIRMLRETEDASGRRQ